MTSCIILHHVESMWLPSYPAFGVGIKDYCEELCKYLHSKSFDRVILTRLEDTSLEDFHHESGIAEYVHQVREYAYGWELSNVDDNNAHEFAPGGQHSEVVWVPEWIKKLPKEVHLCGAFDGSCIEDMEIALTSCGKKVIRVEHLIVGSPYANLYASREAS